MWQRPDSSGSNPTLCYETTIHHPGLKRRKALGPLCNALSATFGVLFEGRGICQCRPAARILAEEPVKFRRLVVITLANGRGQRLHRDRKSTRLNSSHVAISYAVFC